MSSFHAHASGQIPAPPEKIYALLADYRDGHPGILPNPPFVGIEVLKGGIGAGTEIRVHMKMFSKERFLLGMVSEPEPGRILAETFEESTTTFTVDPAEGGTYLTIATRGKTAFSGFLGMIEGWVSAYYLEYIYRKELGLIGAKSTV